MALYEVFSYPLGVKYKANLCSKTTLFYLITQILIFILPALLIYSEGMEIDDIIVYQFDIVIS